MFPILLSKLLCHERIQPRSLSWSIARGPGLLGFSSPGVCTRGWNHLEICLEAVQCNWEGFFLCLRGHTHPKVKLAAAVVLKGSGRRTITCGLGIRKGVSPENSKDLRNNVDDAPRTGWVKRGEPGKKVNEIRTNCILKDFLISITSFPLPSLTYWSQLGVGSGPCHPCSVTWESWPTSATGGWKLVLCSPGFPAQEFQAQPSSSI